MEFLQKYRLKTILFVLLTPKKRKLFDARAILRYNKEE